MFYGVHRSADVQNVYRQKEKYDATLDVGYHPKNPVRNLQLFPK